MKKTLLPLLLLPALASADIYIIPGFSGGMMTYDNGDIDYKSGSTALNLTVAHDSGFYIDGEYREDDDDGQGITRSASVFTAGKRFSTYDITAFIGHQSSETSSLGDKDIDEEDIVFDNSGMFIGLNKGFPTGERSKVSTHIAYGQMDIDRSVEINNSKTETTGTSNGYSAGIAYSHSFKNNVGLSLGGKLQDYQKDGDLESERISLLYFRVSYQIGL